jgi:acetyl-CoA synthetase
MDKKANTEDNFYFPSKDILRKANVKEYETRYLESINDPCGFWAAEAKKLDWYKKWDKVLDDTNKPFYKWFTGGKINIVYNALDRHQHNATRNKLAIIWEGEPGDVRTFSYHALNREVSKFANILKAMGAKKGDVITIYMPQIPELVIAMLACARMGAVHSVVYGGFSVEALAERIHDSESRILITADGGYRRGKTTQLKAIANEAMQRSATIEVCITV